MCVCDAGVCLRAGTGADTDRLRVCVTQVFACMQELLKTEEDDSDRMLHNIHDLATQLYQNVS